MDTQSFYNVAAPAGGIFGAIGNVVSTAMNNNTQIKLQQQANEWNAQMAAQANQWSIDQWNRENEYNSPVNQMKRLQEAGINPALAYSNGVFNQAATSPDVQTPAAAHAARTQAAQIDPNLFANLRIADAQSELLKSQANEADANAELARSRVPIAQQEIENLNQQIKESISRINNFDAQTNLLNEQSKTESEKRKSLQHERHMLTANYNLAVAQFKEQKKVWQSEVGLNNANAKHALEQAKLVGQQLYELQDSWLMRRATMEAEEYTASAEMIESIKLLEQYGFFFDQTTGQFTYDPDKNSMFSINNKEWILWSKAVASIIGTVFGGNLSIVASKGRGVSSKK